MKDDYECHINLVPRQGECRVHAQKVARELKWKFSHSAKPPEMRRMIERISPLERIELFARERVPGWDAFGNEVAGGVQILGWDYKTASVV
jgi:N6-adenosine-specific RNA methylase IME4